MMRRESSRGRRELLEDTRLRWDIVLPFATTTCAGSYEARPTSASKRGWRINNRLLIHSYLDMLSVGRYWSWGCLLRPTWLRPVSRERAC
jgi:hypothetical protein